LAKLTKYLKPFTVGLLLSIVLLFVQALSDLNLPNYMSNIVNVGIQQSGIEHAAPEQISEQGLELITTFMTDDERKIVEDSYFRETEAEKIIYSKVETAPTDEVDKAFATATMTLFNLLSTFNVENETNTDATIDLSKLYEALPMLSQMPTEEARTKALANDETLRKQSGIVLTKAFYEELGVDLNKKQTAYIIKIGLFMLVIALIGGIAMVFVSLLSSRIAAGVARNLRKDVFAKVETFSNNEFDQFGVSSLITRCTNDVMQIQTLVMMGIRMICYAPIVGIGGVIMAIDKSPSMSWIIAVAVIVLLGLMLIIMVVAIPKFKLMQKMVDKLNLVSRESLTGLMVIRAFGNTQQASERFDEANTDLAKINLFINRVIALLMPMMMLLMNGVSLLIIWVGAHQIENATFQVGDMMAFMQYAMQIIMAFLMLSVVFILVPRAAVSATRISAVLEAPLTIANPENSKEMDTASKGMVSFKNVHFRYQGAAEDALQDITFTAEPGKTTAIIGSTGSGKSTIANLILRFYDATAGEVTVSGVNVRDVKQQDLRKQIGYVPQKSVLLAGTIADNLKYGLENATDEEMRKAAEIAQALNFISEKEEQFDVLIAQGGDNVSGGQKQRLSIARAIIRRPEILIFDDSFSALDFKTDASLRKALAEDIHESTVIVITQRVSTIKNAEQIVVLDRGKIVGIGTHTELLGSCPEYLEIASSQLSKEELA